MKSALELAMERTAKLVSDDVAGLSEGQKQKIAAIESEFQAKIAEGEIMLEQKIRKAVSKDPRSAESTVLALREEFRAEKEQWESKKAAEIEKVKQSRKTE